MSLLKRFEICDPDDRVIGQQKYLFRSSAEKVARQITAEARKYGWYEGNPNQGSFYARRIFR